MQNKNIGYVVLYGDKNSFESFFSEKGDAIDRAIFLSESKKLDIKVKEVDDESFARYLLNYRSDDDFLNVETVFDSKKHLKKVSSSIFQTFPLEGIFEYANPSLFDYVKKGKDFTIVLSLPNEQNKLIVANLSSCRLQEVDIKDLEFKTNFLLDEASFTKDIQTSLAQIRKNITIDANTSSPKSFYKSFFQDLSSTIKYGITFDDFNKLSANNLKDIDLNRYSDKSRNPLFHEDIFLIYNKKDSEHYYKTFDFDDDAFNFIVNNLDQSKFWNYLKVSTLLKEYKTICEDLNKESDFSCENDIINNDGAFKEILKFREDYYKNVVSSLNKESVATKSSDLKEDLSSPNLFNKKRLLK